MFSNTPYISRLSLLVARFAAVLATLLSAWLVYVAFRYANVQVNWGDAPCIEAARTRWGYWMKIPVAIPGLLVYLGIAVLTFRINAWDEKLTEDRFWPVLMVLVTVAAGASTWLFGAQVALLRYVCPQCMIVNFCGLMLFATFVFFMRSRPWTLAMAILLTGVVFLLQVGIGPPAPNVANNAGGAAEATMPGTANSGAGKNPQPAIDQLDRPPNTDLTHNIFSVSPEADLKNFEADANLPLTYVPIVSVLDGADTNRVPAVAAVLSEPRSLQEVLEEEEARQKAEGTFRTHVTLGSGKIYLRLDDVPMIGDPRAPMIIAVMYDYTIPECVKMLQFLRRQVGRYRGALAVALLPMPLDHNCNKSMRFTPEQYRGSCEYVRASLQVWLTNPGKHLEFEEYVTENRKATPLHKVEWLAERLVNREVLTPMDLERQTERQIGRNTSLWKSLEFGALPKLIFEEGVTTGTPQIPEDMDAFMSAQLGVQPEEE